MTDVNVGGSVALKSAGPIKRIFVGSTQVWPRAATYRSTYNIRAVASNNLTNASVFASLPPGMTVANQAAGVAAVDFKVPTTLLPVQAAASNNTTNATAELTVRATINVAGFPHLKYPNGTWRPEPTTGSFTVWFGGGKANSRFSSRLLVKNLADGVRVPELWAKIAGLSGATLFSTHPGVITGTRTGVGTYVIKYDPSWNASDNIMFSTAVGAALDTRYSCISMHHPATHEVRVRVYLNQTQLTDSAFYFMMLGK